VSPATPERTTRRRPQLLALVFGVLLALLGVTTAAQAVLVTVHFSATALDAAAARDRSMVRLLVLPELGPADLRSDGVTEARRQLLRERLSVISGRDDIAGLEILAPDGRVIVSTTPGREGDTAPSSQSLDRALGGEVGAELVPPADPGGPTALIEYFPLTTPDGGVDGIVRVERDAGPILARLEATRRDILLVTVGAAACLALLLVWIFRAAHVRLKRQTAELIEADRRDPLTGLHNHGAAMGLLAAALSAESADAAQGSDDPSIDASADPSTDSGGGANVALSGAAPDGTAACLAIVDLDNFRLLNETHGHSVGDRALLEAAVLLDEVTASDLILARYGPDEFLIAGTGELAGLVETAVADFRAALAEVALAIEDGDPLPLTVSVGIAHGPHLGMTPAELLSAAGGALEEAKVGGGDKVRLARDGAETLESGRFDALKGLVIAIDSKDRYTKRHSEDVARYAIFLAGRLGLDDETRRAIHLAGLLHDVGKIGIPEPILRKPARLTAEERAIVEQHVVLGDMIVRDLPGIDLVRSAIRSHHERWDGKGYVDQLEGEGIPLIARILSVADSFSAMTTSRPYRKALPIEEALRRIEDASATQLDERLVAVFLDGIRNAPDAPLPGVVEAPATLWAPLRRVA
jgi:diguanylate cyclase (GGDEF)-like protein